VAAIKSLQEKIHLCLDDHAVVVSLSIMLYVMSLPIMYTNIRRPQLADHFQSVGNKPPWLREHLNMHSSSAGKFTITVSAQGLCIRSLPIMLLMMSVARNDSICPAQKGRLAHSRKKLDKDTYRSMKVRHVLVTSDNVVQS
jgi:hypothetical protein